MTTGASSLGQYLQKAELPAMPAIASSVIMMTQDPNRSMGDLRKVIEKDPAIVAQILKASNSAIFGSPGGINSLSHALSLLGMKTIRNLVLSASMKQTMRRFGLMEKLLLEHSVVAGPLAAKFASWTPSGVDPDDAFTAGLLHDVGKTALANSHHDEYEDVVARVYNDKVSFCQAERDRFGFDHGELGVAIAMKWNLPDALVTVIGHHHSPDTWDSLPSYEANLTAAVALTTTCLTHLGVGRRGPAKELRPSRHPAWARLGLAPEDEARIIEDSLEVATIAQTTHV